MAKGERVKIEIKVEEEEIIIECDNYVYHIDEKYLLVYEGGPAPPAAVNEKSMLIAAYNDVKRFRRLNDAGMGT